MRTKVEPNYAYSLVGYVEGKSCTREEHHRFIGFVNHFHPAVKVTWEISVTSVTFLDINFSVNRTI